MAHGANLNISDADEMQEVVAPTVGESRVQPARGADFHARLCIKPRGQVGMFTVRANSIHVQLEPNMPFFGINLPLGRPLTIAQASRSREFLDDLNLTRPDRPIDIKACEDCRVMAVFLYRDVMQRHVNRLTRSARPLESRMQTRMSMKTPAAHALVISLARLWSTPRYGSQATPGAHIRYAELEDEVLTNYVLAATSASEDPDRNTPDTSKRCVRLAEDYLCAHLNRPVCRAELAEACDVSIRTLSRGFVRRHGMGPMRFLKARRLKAAYRDLLGSNPWSTSVTEVALRYGFTHLGKFAIDYRQAFGESPSATLRG